MFTYNTKEAWSISRANENRIWKKEKKKKRDIL